MHTYIYKLTYMHSYIHSGKLWKIVMKCEFTEGCQEI